jgi:hypothetical protein
LPKSPRNLVSIEKSYMFQLLPCKVILLLFTYRCN